MTVTGNTWTQWAALWMVTMVVGCGAGHDPAIQAGQRPNLLLILADDLGYTDLGAFGGEIDTPNLDRLAWAGVRLTNLHAGASCAPTRAMLMSGTDNHLAGMGGQPGLTTPGQRGHASYQDRLSPTVPSLAERLRDAGYATFMSGKWHLGSARGDLPGARGFERTFILTQGGANHFGSRPMLPRYARADWYADGRPVDPDDSFYSTTGLTDALLGFLDTHEDDEDDRPFFAYLAYTAPHWPLQAPDELLQKYRGRYDAGYDALLERRIEGAHAAGVVPANATGVRSYPTLQPWTELDADTRARLSAGMTAYAAMVDALDQGVGRVVSWLHEHGQLDNTVIVFLSDNGAEGHAMEAVFADWVNANFDNRLENIGRGDSYVTTGLGFARASAAPWRGTKARLSEGGVRVPGFVRLPGGREGGRVDAAWLSVRDIVPTFLELAGAPTDAHIIGRSWLQRLRGGAAALYGPDEVLAAEQFGRRSVQVGNWKALLMEAPWGTGEWQLYNLAEDPGEQVDVAAEHPRRVRELARAWRAYARRVGVVEPERSIYY